MDMGKEDRMEKKKIIFRIFLNIILAVIIIYFIGKILSSGLIVEPIPCPSDVKDLILYKSNETINTEEDAVRVVKAFLSTNYSKKKIKEVYSYSFLTESINLNGIKKIR